MYCSFKSWKLGCSVVVNKVFALLNRFTEGYPNKNWRKQKSGWNISGIWYDVISMVSGIFKEVDKIEIHHS